MAPEALEQAVVQQLHALDSRLPLSEVETMSEYLDDMTAVERFTSVILASFAGIGLLLAVMGIYGVIAYLVAQRTQEIGIRLALAPRECRRMAGVITGTADDSRWRCDWTGGNGLSGTSTPVPGFSARS